MKLRLGLASISFTRFLTRICLLIWLIFQCACFSCTEPFLCLESGLPNDISRKSKWSQHWQSHLLCTRLYDISMLAEYYCILGLLCRRKLRPRPSYWLVFFSQNGLVSIHISQCEELWSAAIAWIVLTRIHFLLSASGGGLTIIKAGFACT